MPNYQNGKVYKIINPQNEVIYIGSTVEKLCRRFSKHKHRDNGNKIILLENYPCNSKEELCMKEQEHIESHENLLNQMRAYNSEEYYKKYIKEYYEIWRENNKEKKSEYNSTYRLNNIDKVNEAVRKCREKYDKKITCECGCEIRKYDMIRHKKTKKHIKFIESITTL